MSRIILISLIIVSFFASCKEKNTTSNTSANNKKTEITDIRPNENSEEEKPIVKKRFIDEERSQAKSELDKFFSKKPKPIVFLTTNYYVVDYISDGKQGPKDMLDFGEWYKFGDDFKYQHGFFAEIKDQGKYSYYKDKKLLLMLPEDKKDYPSEWKILSSGDVVVLVGTPKFSNNPFQKHMQNVKEKPTLRK